MTRKLIAPTIFLIAAGSLITEISLIRAFDVLFLPNIAYMIITCTLLALGLAGVYTAIRPIPPDRDIYREMGKYSLWFAISVAAILPILNLLPFNLNNLATQPFVQILYFGGMYIAIALPFFLVGLMFSSIFARFAANVQYFYFWDLAGAALGSIIIIPLISFIGPGGLLFLASALGLIASALFFSVRRPRSIILLAVAATFIVVPLVYSPSYFDFIEHQGKRGVKNARETGLIQTTVWDPISKIDVIEYENVRYIAYDGGSQTSLFYPFDGDFQALQGNLETTLDQHFWQRGVLVSHMLLEGTNPDVLVIGSAGGQEIKAALMYGAGHVDGVELVGAVVELGKRDYADYIGGIFQHPSVSLHVDEGRNFLRSSQARYDIIQIFSNHTSSSVAAGTGAIATNYLQTSEAYQEYFSSLNDDGVLHINHFYYPKMITTAALAWAQMGRTNFARHVLVYDYSLDESLPTLLIKMSPWTEEEVQKIDQFFNAEMPGDPGQYTLVINPVNPEENVLPLSYFSGDLSPSQIEEAETRIIPSTDDRPYFNLLDKSLYPFPNGLSAFVQDPFANVSQGVITLYVSGFVALLCAFAFTILPLQFSNIGRQKWPNKAKTLIYFSCLGLGFIIIEFVFIQLFMHLIGSPLFTYSTVLFTMLLSAGLGSLTSVKLQISPSSRWHWPFIGILITVAILLFTLPSLKEMLLGTPLTVRILASFAMMLPVGFFMGMPFPLGILSLANHPDGAIAWAWGMNGLFTVVGGMLGVFFSVQWGFTITIVIAAATYVVAFLMFAQIRGTAAGGEGSLGTNAGLVDRG